MDKKTTRVLLIEDNPASAKIALRMLREAGLDSNARVEGTLAGGLAALAAERADIALLDLCLPDSEGLATVKTTCSKFPDLPVVVMTGTDDEAMGRDSLKEGAQDYLVKGQFGDKELARTILHAIERKGLLNEKEELISKLQEALKRVNLLTGLLPTCADCKRIRNAKGVWVQMETYISDNSGALFTHGICDVCLEKRIREIK